MNNNSGYRILELLSLDLNAWGFTSELITYRENLGHFFDDDSE